MLHEILFAMLGKLGGVIIDSDGIFRVNPALDFISQAERELLEKIVVLGSFYQQLKLALEGVDKAFAQHALNRQADEETQTQTGASGSAYIRCFCGVVRDLLTEYEGEVLAVEQEYLAAKVYTFSKFAVRFAKFYAIFPEAIVLFERIEKEGLRGGKLIDTAYRCSVNGDEEIRRFHCDLLQRLYQVLYHQVVVWIIHGRLHDTFGEFFIHRLKPEPEDEESTVEDWNNTFGVRLSMLPSCIVSQITADKILFIGKYVRVANRTKDDTLKRVYSPEAVQTIKSLAKFDYVNFQDGIESIKAEVGKEFLIMFLKKENIEEHLKYLKDYYLLGRGDFYQIFIEETQNLMKFPPTTHAESDINKRILPAVLMRLNWTNPKLLKLIRFNLVNTGFDYHEFSHLHGLIAKGDVTQPANSIRFGPARRGPTSSCLYHPSPQLLATGFKFNTSFKFRRTLSTFDSGQQLPPELRELKGLPSDVVGMNCLAFVVQNCVDINSKEMLPRLPQKVSCESL